MSAADFLKTLSELIQYLPNLIKLFVPGFVLISIYRRFTSSSSEVFENTAIWSLTISYIISLFFDWFKDMDDNLKSALAIVMAVVIAVLLVKARTMDKTKSIFQKIGKETGSLDIWNDLLNSDLGTGIQGRIEYKGQNVVIRGTVLYFQACSDGECNIVLKPYTIIENEGEDNENQHIFSEFKLRLNTKNIKDFVVVEGSDNNPNKKRKKYLSPVSGLQKS